MSTGFGPTSSAVGMFEPVTMTRSASAPGGVGAATMSVDSGGRFWANALEAIMRGIPTQAPIVMRRNPNLEYPVLIMVSPFVRLGWTLRRVQAAPDVKSGFFSRKPEGSSKCQAQNFVLRHFPWHLHGGCRKWLQSSCQITLNCAWMCLLRESNLTAA